jgi:flavin-dependent dehydrogenase
MAAEFDVIIVGARCAGSPLAMLLARRGLQVCVVDRSRFPSDVPSTHGVQPAGVRQLDTWELGEHLCGMPHPSTAASSPGAGEDRISGDHRLAGCSMLNLRRITLDIVLIEAAAQAGATVMLQTAVEGLVQADG